ncbi:MAG: YkgJ family cysteine cluster protein [Methanoregula sp.]|jgi:hypothetical protein|nr:YkgJ family cysteine cluster protein [Methanoregula sp.]
MISIKSLTEKITSIGFECRRCGTCCRCVSPDSNLVMVSPGEVRAIIASTGLVWDRIAEPYPATINDRSGARFTLGWYLRRENDRCRFLDEITCTIYNSRPWICRTYPFVLDEDMLVVSSCEGLGQPLPEQEAGLSQLPSCSASLPKRRKSGGSGRSFSRPHYRQMRLWSSIVTVSG